MPELVKIAALAGTIGLLAVPALAAEAQFDLEPFTTIDISSGITATVTVGSAQNVRATAPSQEELDELIVEVRDGRLTARVDWNLLDFMFGERDISVDITVPDLHSVDVSSGADVQLDGLAADALTLNASSGGDLTARAATADSYRIDVSSGADLRIDGQCGSATINVSSGGTLLADALQCQSVEVEASSGGDADVHAGARIKADVSSGGDVRVSGNPPERELDESSGGQVAFAN